MVDGGRVWSGRAANMKAEQMSELLKKCMMRDENNKNEERVRKSCRVRTNTFPLSLPSILATFLSPHQLTHPSEFINLLSN
jgi:galactose-1-phosphate uridylyltransferase